MVKKFHQVKGNIVGWNQNRQKRNPDVPDPIAKNFYLTW
jgi:hypothetical protein